jgi:hypothetical protein
MLESSNFFDGTQTGFTARLSNIHPNSPVLIERCRQRSFESLSSISVE